MRTSKIALLVIFIGCIFLQCSKPETAVRQIQNGIILETATLNLKVQFYSDKIVRIIKWLPGGTPEKLSLVVIPGEISNLPINFQEKGNHVILAGSQIKLKIAKGSGNIHYLTSAGGTILMENSCTFKPVSYAGDSAFQIEQNFRLTPEEGIYGLGQHQDGYLNYRGKTVKLVQSNTDAVTPFLVSTQGYGILWDNYSKTIFNDGETGTSLWSDVGDNIDYYLIYGSNLDSVIAGYRDLTGPAPMYGKWAYGYWQSKEHYANRAELLGVVQEYRKRKIPIDNIIQDWDYWNGAANWSGMFFDQTKYPQPKEMIDRLHSQNFHLMISIWPALGPNTAVYKEMRQRGFLYKPIGWGNFRYYDAFNPAANQLYWQYLKNGLLSKGVDAWWIDSTEPDVRNATTKEATEYELKKMGRNYLGSWARYLNAFSLSMTDALYQNLRQETKEKRAYILTRSTFAGQQRNAATIWSGDIGASWEIYRKQIAAGLNHCMAGIPYWTFDIGAFVIGAYGGLFTTGGKNPAYQELYCRMFQFGTFCPIFRSHGSETPREIWEVGEFVNTLIKFDNLRYRILSYIYSLAWKTTNEGYTIMRGLPMDFCIDRKTYQIDDQFMFGPAIMVCPVTEYMIYRPPQSSVFIKPKYFKTKDGQPGLKVYYYRDLEYKNFTHTEIVSAIDLCWYTGRPEYVTDSTFAICWEGKIVPDQTGQYQFHLISYDAKRIYLNGVQLKMVYTSVEQYTEQVELEAGKEYDFVMELENRSTGAAKAILNWKTPAIFAQEKVVEKREQTRAVYLPEDNLWFDFWTGKSYPGGQTIVADAPINIIPLFVRAGSIIPFGPFIQYSTEKPADPIELRIYPGADGQFSLYEDENDNYNYEKGVYALINFSWDDAKRQLIISNRIGEFPGMLKERTFNLVLVKEGFGVDLDITIEPTQVVQYSGKELIIQF